MHLPCHPEIRAVPICLKCSAQCDSGDEALWLSLFKISMYRLEGPNESEAAAAETKAGTSQ